MTYQLGVDLSSDRMDLDPKPSSGWMHKRHRDLLVELDEAAANARRIRTMSPFRGDRKVLAKRRKASRRARRAGRR